MLQKRSITCTLSVVLVLTLLGPAAPPAAAQAPVLGEIIDIATVGYDYFHPSVAYNSVHDEWLVVWHNTLAGGGFEVCGQRVGREGRRGIRYVIASSPGREKTQPVAAYSPTQDEYLIVYTYESLGYGLDIWAVRASWDLLSISNEFAIYPNPYVTPADVLNGDTQENPAVTYNSGDDEFIITWEWQHSTGGLRDIWARRMRGSDGWLSPAACVATGGDTGGDGRFRVEPDVAYNAARNNCLIAYTRQDVSDGDIYGKTVPAGLAGASTITETQIIYNTYDQHSVALAAGPDEFLAVWSDGPSASHRTIYGRRLNGDGSLAATCVPIADTPAWVYAAPAAALSWGERYLVTWQHEFLLGGVEPDADLYGRYVCAGQDSPAGGIFAIDWRLKEQRYPALACDFGGDCLVVEEDYSGGSLYEIRGRFVGPHRLYLPLALRNP